MKIAIVPSSSMFLEAMVDVCGHQPLVVIKQINNKQRDEHKGELCDKNAPPYNMTSDNPKLGIMHTLNEVPCGVRGHISLNHEFYEIAEAAIIMKPLRYNQHEVFNPLTDMMLFGCTSCPNSSNLSKLNFKKKDIPILEFNYPSSQKEIIEIVGIIRKFLFDLNDKNLYEKLKKERISLDNGITPKIPFDEFKDIINENYL